MTGGSTQNPSRPALKKLPDDLLDWFMRSEREIYLTHVETCVDKDDNFGIGKNILPSC